MSTTLNTDKEDNKKVSGEAQREQEDEDETSCAICLLALDDEQMRCKLLSCQHDYFHYDCLMRWAQMGSLTCPLCKMTLTTLTYGDRVVHIESFLASQRLHQNQNQLNVDGSGMREEEEEDDDYEEDDEEDYFDACLVCGEECVPEGVIGGALSEMGPSVFCNCGECVHLFCIGRR